jgi:hypothetical protein
MKFVVNCVNSFYDRPLKRCINAEWCTTDAPRCTPMHHRCTVMHAGAPPMHADAPPMHAAMHHRCIKTYGASVHAHAPFAHICPPLVAQPTLMDFLFSQRVLLAEG